MRFGCCANMVATGPDGIGLEIVEQLAEIGYDYIELSLAHMMALSEAEFRALALRAWRAPASAAKPATTSIHEPSA